MMRRNAALFLVFLTACGGSAAVGASTTTLSGSFTTTVPSTASTTTLVAASSPNDQPGGCAHVIEATVEWSTDTASFSATVKSADTGWDKYADVWEVRAEDGRVLAERVLTHPHKTEQPFTRSVSGVEIPSDVTSVVLVAHDTVAGWCGDEFTLDLPSRP